MNIFVDTGAWIALADENDIKHSAAKKIYELLKKKNISLIISDYIFDETTTWLHYKAGHGIACNWGNKILDSHMVKMVKVKENHIEIAWDIFQKYHDQKFSFTDCVSFSIMKSMGINMTFAYDSHFSTMGFILIGEDNSFNI
jgi:hypothetical protein